jgi:DNA-binding beta-propeller fold protein YncE
LHLARIEAEGNTQSRPHRRAVRTVAQALRSPLRFALASAALASAIGCGNTYRPVVSAINPVGPAAQPQKFAVAISTTSTATANTTATFSSGASSITVASATSIMSGQLVVGAGIAPGTTVSGPPSGTTVNLSFPTTAAESSTPVVFDNPTPGLVTFVDAFGDSVLITDPIGVNPYYLILNSGGTTGFTLNSDHTLTSFGVSTTLLPSQILQTTLLPGANPASIFPDGTNTYVSDPTENIAQGVISQFTGQPPTLQQQLAIPAPFTPLYVVGISGAPRVYAITPSSTGGGPGQVSTIETTSNTIDPTPIPVGHGPVYGVMTADARRAFIMNQTDGTVSVINAQTNQLDIVPTGATNPISVGTSPLWADFAPALNEMVVANAGDGVHQGSVSIISIPLCSANALPSNPNCDLNNPVDAAGFGTVLATVPVGINPRMIAVLQDTTNSRAYVVNGGDPNLPCAAPTTAQPLGNCTVSVINLASNTVTATIPIPLSVLPISPILNGHPNYIAVTNGTPTGKVYVTSPESNFMTVIRTDIDALDLTIPLQGNGVSVRVTLP